MWEEKEERERKKKRKAAVMANKADVWGESEDRLGGG